MRVLVCGGGEWGGVLVSEASCDTDHGHEHLKVTSLEAPGCLRRLLPEPSAATDEVSLHRT